MGWCVLTFIWTGFARAITLGFSGNTTASALTAVFAANLVLVAYIVVSVQEEAKARATTTPATGETKKTQ